MSKISYIIFFGALVFLAPFTAFPSVWKSIFYVVAGLSVVVLGSLCRKENRVREPQKDFSSPIPTETFVENHHSGESN